MRALVAWRAVLTAAALTAGGCDPAIQKLGRAGDAAADLVHDVPHTRLTLEVDFFGGAASTPLVRDLILQEVAALVDKPEPVTWTSAHPFDDYAPGPGGSTYSDLATLESHFRDERTADDMATVYTLVLPGHWQDDTDERRTLILAHGPTTLVLFPDAVEAACGAALSALDNPDARASLCPWTEAAAWLHGFGHLLGLAGGGAPMVRPHRDPSPGNHCANRSCVMHPDHVRRGLAPFIGRRLEDRPGAPQIFGDDCLADLAAYRSGLALFR